MVFICFSSFSSFLSFFLSLLRLPWKKKIQNTKKEKKYITSEISQPLGCSAQQVVRPASPKHPSVFTDRIKSHIVFVLFLLSSSLPFVFFFFHSSFECVCAGMVFLNVNVDNTKELKEYSGKKMWKNDVGLFIFYFSFTVGKRRIVSKRNQKRLVGMTVIISCLIGVAPSPHVDEHCLRTVGRLIP